MTDENQVSNIYITVDGIEYQAALVDEGGLVTHEQFEEVVELAIDGKLRSIESIDPHGRSVILVKGALMKGVWRHEILQK